jgi:nucleoside 2-deoxyribosyltransferase
MGYLNGKSVYLAGPIHDVTDDGVGWREMITPRLTEFGIVVTDPTKKTIYGEVADDKTLFKQLASERRFDELKEKFWPVVRKDLRMIDKADFLIAVYSPNVKMLGTIHELVIAQNQRKPIILFCKDSEAEDINPWVLTFAKKGCFFTKWDDVIKHLQEVDKGNFDYNYWTL